MNPALQPFLTVALPIMVTLVAAMWSNNSRLSDLSKRIDDLNTSLNRRIDETSAALNRRIDESNFSISRRLDDIVTRLDRIERKLDDHEQRLIRVEERTSPVVR